MSKFTGDIGREEDQRYAREMNDQKELRGFVRELMMNWTQDDVYGIELHDLAIKYGLIKLKNPQPRAPCCDECACRENFDLIEFAAGNVECYESTELLRGL